MSKDAFAYLLPGETPIDISELLVSNISTRADLSRIEAKNIRKVLVKYFGGDFIEDIAPFDFAWIQELHREMYGEVWRWAGNFRLRDLNIGGPWQHINEKLFNLIEDLKCWERSGVDIVEQAAGLHHAAVQIHPFPNGNGRWARTLTNIWLVLHRAPTVQWPEHLIGDVSPIRDEYLVALKAADNGDIAPLIAMHRFYLSAD